MRIISILAGLALAFAANHTSAQDYPAKPVRVIVPFTPGSGTDIFARTVCPKLAETWGQQVVVENRTGAGGAIASGAVAKSPADGHTLLWHSTAFATSPAVQRNLPYEPLREFAAVSPLLSQPYALVLSPAAGFRTVAELIAAAEARPGHITCGSTGLGTSSHFAAEKFRIAAGIDAVHVPYKGGPRLTAT
jgi:tripartite-type tricarboxylate transporter receptor subunit TctC